MTGPGLPDRTSSKNWGGQNLYFVGLLPNTERDTSLAHDGSAGITANDGRIGALFTLANDVHHIPTRPETFASP